MCSSCNQYWRATRDNPQTERAKFLCEVAAGHDVRKAEVAAKWDAERTRTRFEKPGSDRYRVMRDYTLRSRYGITLERYEVMLAEQGGVCAVCHNPPKENKGPLYVDHCHTTGQVRGLLCARCNTFVGFIDTDVGVLDRVVEYSSRGKNI